MDDLLRSWIQFVVSKRTELVLAMDWTEFDGDDQSTLAVYMITNHGRATPLTWRTYSKQSRKGNQKRYEFEMIERLHEWLDPSIGITLLADRGFGDQKIYNYQQFLGWNYVIRFRACIKVTSDDGTTQSARKWIRPDGKARLLLRAKVTEEKSEVPAVVIVHDKKMKDAWCLATSFAILSALEIVKRYGRRFTIEETFRDQKNGRFGMRLSATHIHSPIVVTSCCFSRLSPMGY